MTIGIRSWSFAMPVLPRTLMILNFIVQGWLYVQVHSCTAADDFSPCDSGLHMFVSNSPRSESSVTDAVVTTAKGLKAALASGAAHIEIQAHLDFTQHGEVHGVHGKNDTVMVLPSTVKSLRGNCKGHMPRVDAVGLVGETLTEQRPGQCLLAFAGRPNGQEDSLWALSTSSDMANAVWIDNLYLRAGNTREERPGSAFLFGAFRKNGERDKVRAGPSVYMTRMTFQGSRQSPVVAVAASTRVLVHDSKFVDVGDYAAQPSRRISAAATSAAEVVESLRAPVTLALNSTTAVLRDCEFRNVRAVNAPIISHQLGVAGVQVEGCVFEENDSKHNFGTWSGGMFFSDAAQEVLLMELNTTTSARPLHEVSSHQQFSFLSTADSDDVFYRMLEELQVPATGADQLKLLTSATAVASRSIPSHVKLIAAWAVVLLLVSVTGWRQMMHERKLKQRQQLLLTKTASAAV